MKYLFIALVLGSVFISYKANKHPSKLFWSDMEGYYIYLPATFIYGGFDKVKVADKEYLKPFSETNSKIYTKYTCGVALLEAPFFLVAHLLSKPLGFPSDGHSLPYSYGIMLAGLFYFWLGIFYLHKFLVKNIFQEYTLSPSLWALGSIALGTNLFYYTFFQPAMSHVYSFGLASLLFYLGDGFFRQKQIRFSRIPLIAALLGLMVLIRPTNVVYVLYFLLLAVFKNRLRSLFTLESIKWLLMGGVIVVLIWLPQVYYWYYISGEYVIWSYMNESFIYLKDPKIWKVLFGAWNGWILYSPIVLLPLGRLFYGVIKNKHGELAVLLTLSVATYLFASWWAWWFGGAFGHRCYVDFLPLLVLPMAQVLNQSKSKWIYLLLLLLMYYNVGLTYQYVDSAPWDGPNWGYEQVWMVVKKLVGLE